MLFSVITAFLFSQAVHAQNFEGFRSDIQAFPQGLQTAWNSTVKVDVIQSTRGSQVVTGGWEGTAFIVQVNPATETMLLATNYHVAHCKNGSKCTYTLQISNKSWKAQVVTSYANIDLSFLKVSKIDSATMANVTPLHLSEEAKTFSYGNDVFAIGYPNTRLRKNWQRAHALGRIQKVISQGLAIKNFSSRANYYPISDQGSEGKPAQYISESTWAFSADILSGNSGGPLLDRDGNVIAMVSNINGSHEATAGLPYCFTDGSTNLKGNGCFYAGVSAEIIASKLKEISL